MEKTKVDNLKFLRAAFDQSVGNAQLTTQSRVHAVFCALQDLVAELPDDLTNFMRDFTLVTDQWPPLKSLPVVDGASVAGLANLTLTLTIWPIANQAMSGHLMPTLRMLVAGPPRETIETALLREGCGEVACIETYDVENGIVGLEQMDRAATLNLKCAASPRRISEASNILKHFVRDRPQGRVFAYGPGEHPKWTPSP